ncbi:hypothetical protein [Brevibacillus sp. DP1.3A]|uniref:hypothetical protein n=1 Tax=Brevibacillus sp. DP1.3A TaxID=2738867 RepID=UPI00156ABC36|nr:hypothetical protein [Brevibacillus sp. DP1.3A]UED74632.1 hypothetical protein HP399_028715 [Brevibacillus sp. DP1.3A]
MDIGSLLNIVKSIPKEKLRTDAGIKEVIREMARKSGKKLTEQEVNSYAAQFRQMQKTENVGSLLNKLSKKGVTAKDLDNIKKRFR